MLLALNAFRVVSTGPTPSTNRTPIGLLLALTRRGAEVAPPATNRTPIGLLLALTRPAVPAGPPPAALGRTPIGLLLALTRPSILTEPPIEPVEPPAEVVGGYAGGGGRAGRGRMIRRRKPGELDLEAPPLSPYPPDLAPPAPGPKPPDLLPPQPGLLADMVMPQRKPLPPHVDEDEDEIALLLELLS